MPHIRIVTESMTILLPSDGTSGCYRNTPQNDRQDLPAFSLYTLTPPPVCLPFASLPASRSNTNNALSDNDDSDDDTC